MATKKKTATKKAATSKKTATAKKSTAAKKTVAKKPAKKATPVKKTAVKKTATAKKAAAPKKAAAKKATPQKTVAKKAATKKVTPSNKTATKKSVAKKAAPTKTAAKKVAPKKKSVTTKTKVTNVKKETKKSAPAKAPAAKKAVAKKAVAKKAAPAKDAVAKKEAPAKKVAAKKSAKKTVTKKATVTKITSKNVTPTAKPRPTRRNARDEGKQKVIVAHRKLADRNSDKDAAGKTMINYQPDFTRSILDSPIDQQGPVYRYSDEELNEFRVLITGRLEAARKELGYLQGLITRKDEAGTEDTENRYMSMEDGGGAMEREQLAQLASRQIQFINHLEKAMMRIENKTYGICRVTGKLIDKARLRAVPHATLSIDAKKMMSSK